MSLEGQIATRHGQEVWGLFERPTAADRRHARALMTPDEVAAMDGEACLIFAKGCRPIKGRKLGVPAVNTLTTMRQRYQRPALAASVALVAILTGYVMWPTPTPTPPAPSVALTSPSMPEVRWAPQPTKPTPELDAMNAQARAEAARHAQVKALTRPPMSPTPEPTAPMPVRGYMREYPGWALWVLDQGPMGFRGFIASNGIFGHGERFTTAEACEAAGAGIRPA